MKRRLLTLAIFLLLGAVVNVAVAWGCALLVDVATGDEDSVDERYFYKPYGGFIGNRWRRLSAHRVSLVYYRFREGAIDDGQSMMMPWHQSREGAIDDGQSMEMDELLPSWGVRCLLDEFPVKSASWSKSTIDGRGWPCLSLWGGLIEPNPLVHATPTSLYRTRFAFLLDHSKQVGPHPTCELVLLPLRPIWPGFAFNTLFYAAVLWLVIPGPFALRRLIRRKRGLCVACGYDTRHADHDACPECGAGA